MSSENRKVKQKHYVNNKTLLEELIKHRQGVIFSKQNNQTKPPIPEYIGKCLLLIATRLSMKPNFSNYSYREEMISDGIENCLMYLDNFDPAKSRNPFAYFTQTIHNAFVRRIKKEKKQQYIKIKNMEKTFIFSELVDHIEGQEIDFGGSRSILFDNEITNDFVRNFEDSNFITKKTKIKATDGDENED